MKLILFLSILVLNFVYADPSEAGDQAVQAILEGDANRVTFLLAAENVDVNFQDSHQNSLLHHAVMVGNVDMVQLLIAHGVDLSAGDKFGQTALDRARVLKNSRMISVLESAIQKITPAENKPQDVESFLAGVSQNVSDAQGHQAEYQESQKMKKALWKAVTQPDVNALVSLLSSGGDQYINEVFLDGADSKKYTLLHKVIKVIALYHNPLWVRAWVLRHNQQDINRVREIYKEIIKVLIDFRVDLNFVLDGDTPLTMAIQKELPEIITLLLEKGANPNLSPTGHAYSSPLYLALGRKRNLGLALMLLNHKADINFQYSESPHFILKALVIGYTQEDLPAILFALNREADPNLGEVLQYAVTQKYLQMAQFLLEHGANLNLDEALQIAVHHTDLKMAQLLLEHGANLNLEEALKSAVHHTDLKMAQLLLDQGNNLNLEEALKSAVHNKDLKMAQLLLKHGANLNLDEALKSTLHNKDLQMAQLLLEHGDNPNLGEVLQYAVTQKDLQIIQLLLNHGANPDLPYLSFSAKPTILEHARENSSPEVVQLLESAECRGKLREL